MFPIERKRQPDPLAQGSGRTPCELGNLHDVNIDRTIVDTDAQTLSLHLEDLNANFEGLPGYKFAPATLVFWDVTALALDVDPTDGVRISQALMAR